MAASHPGQEDALQPDQNSRRSHKDASNVMLTEALILSRERIVDAAEEER